MYVRVWCGTAHAAVLVGHRVLVSQFLWRTLVSIRRAAMRLPPPRVTHRTRPPGSSLLFEPHFIQSSRVVPFLNYLALLINHVLPKAFRTCRGKIHLHHPGCVSQTNTIQPPHFISIVIVINHIPKPKARNRCKSEKINEAEN